jgi:hypothetical protein
MCAYEYKNKNYTDAKGILRRELDQELFGGIEEMHGLAKMTVDGRQFYYFQIRKGVDQRVEMATEMNGYVVVAALQAKDPEVVKSLSSAFYHMSFFEPREASQHAGPNASHYDGPAISAQRLREVKSESPAEHLDPGTLSGNQYRNSQIGMTFDFPKGWSYQPEGAVEPAVEHYREKVSGEPALGPRERAAVKACRRTLASAWKAKPDSGGDVPYDEFGEITLSVMPLSCFPNIQFPDDAQDAGAVRRFLVGLSLTEPLQRDMNDARTYEAGGMPFVVTRGTIAYKEQGEALSRRISVATAMTKHRGYLLVWLFAAPHEAELRELMTAKVGFDSESSADGPTSSKAGTGSASQENTQPAAATPSAKESPQSDGPSSAASADTSGDQPASQAAVHPSLLREGEDAQGQAAPAKKPN